MTGMFYTPKEIEKIIDPSTGTGAFLSSAADMLSNPPAGKASRSAAHCKRSIK